MKHGSILGGGSCKTCSSHRYRESLGSNLTTHHNVGDERVQGRIAAGASLPAHADQLHVLAGGCARHIDAQAVQVWLTLSQRLLPIPACSERSMRMHIAQDLGRSSNMSDACSGLLWYTRSREGIGSGKRGPIMAAEAVTAKFNHTCIAYVVVSRKPSHRGSSRGLPDVLGRVAWRGAWGERPELRNPSDCSALAPGRPLVAVLHTLGPPDLKQTPP